MISAAKSETKTCRALFLLAVALLAGCSPGPDASTSASNSPPPIAVTVTPSTASILSTETQAFTAIVVNAIKPGVVWQVDGVQGGNAGVGVISAAGLYTPPAVAGTHSITADSVQDPSKSGSASVAVQVPPPPVAVTVAPATASISTIQTQMFTATVVNATNPAVTWKVDGVQGGNTGVGVISAAGLYTPPVVAGTHSVTATSVQDPTKSGSASVTVQVPPPPVGVTVAPATASISTIQTQMFTATVVNATNPAVTWKVDGVQGGNTGVGVISAAGLYTPPPLGGTHSVTATSVQDPTKSGSASVTVTLPISVTVAPSIASISTLQTQTFVATVVNGTNSAVTWKVDGVQGGNTTVGAISAAGLYAPPAVAGTHSVTATSVQDPSKSGSASVTVTVPPPGITVTVTPPTASISTIQTQTFAATVVNGTNPAVTWKVDGVQGGNASVGTISAAGVYAPSPIELAHSITATSVQDPTKSGSANVTVKFLSGVLTYHNDNARTGQNLQETVLTPGSVTPATFGKLVSFAVDAAVYAQPLYVPNVPIAGQLHNVVFVATEHDSVYAFDADNRTAAPLWQRTFIDPANGITTVPTSDLGRSDPTDPATACADINPEIGITSTPVIDPVTGTLYVVAKTKENGIPKYRLHGLDITTGADKSGAGVEIQASVPGTAKPNDGAGHVVFTAALENQRLALLLNNGVVYFGTSSYCDFGDHHGWFFAYDSATLNQITAVNVTATGTEGGIWQSGGGAAADAGGNVYIVTADGTFDAASGGSNYADTLLKFTGPSLVVSDYFTPFDQATMQAVNADLGSAGVVLLPDQSVGPPHLLVGAGKKGSVYVVNRDNMGGFLASGDSQIVQSFAAAPCGAGSCPIFGTPAYFNNKVYIVVMKDRLKAYSLVAGQLSPAGQSATIFQFPGATPAISANGSSNGIVWALENNGSGAPAVLHAYSAADVSVELYNSNQNATRDVPGSSVKFTVPTIANGKVYVGTQNQLSVFGLLP